MKLTPALTKAITETKYLSVDNHARYRLIMRFFYINHEQINYWLNANDVYDEMRKHIDGYSIDDCRQDLENLVEWGNLINDLDTDNIFKLQEFKNKKFRYQMSDYSVEIERLAVMIENMNVEGSSLDIGLIGTIRVQIEQMRDIRNCEDTELYSWWRSLSENFKRLNREYNETDINIDHDKGDYRRHRVYRKLLFSPVVYSDEEADFGYIKNIRGRIREDIEKMTGFRLDIHRTAAMLVLPQVNGFKNVFPSSKSISDIVLQLNHMIRNTTEIPDNERITMTYPEFHSIVMKLIRGHKSGWSKTYREMTPEEIINDIILYMRSFSMLEYDGNMVTVLPLAGKLTGEYPADYNRKTGRSK